MANISNNLIWGSILGFQTPTFMMAVQKTIANGSSYTLIEFVEILVFLEQVKPEDPAKKPSNRDENQQET